MNSIAEPLPDLAPTGPEISEPSPKQSVDAGGPLALRPIGFYRKALRETLDPAVFQPNPWRLGWYFGCVFGASACLAAMVLLAPIWPLKLLLGVGIGLCTGTMGFVFHEISHGSVISSKAARSVLGFFGTLPYLTSPTYWAFSHDRVHHGRAQKPIEDPDAFPTLRIYRMSRFVQAAFPFTPGSGYKRSWFYFFYWFSFHNFISQTYLRFRNRVYDGMNHRRVTIELAAQVLLMGALWWWAGPSNWLFAFVIPFAIQNYMLMSYISTNHNLSPLTHENDPLVNSLSVTVHPAQEFLNLNFGYHVEHHLFPTMNGKHAKAVHRELRRLFPESYKIMPKSEAIGRLYRTSRIYKNPRELTHPETGEIFATL